VSFPFHTRTSGFHRLTIPLHYYRPPTYDLEFVMRDRYPLDQRKILLGGKPPCYVVIVVMKYFKDD
jgi:hypothetical protein